MTIKYILLTIIAIYFLGCVENDNTSVDKSSLPQIKFLVAGQSNAVSPAQLHAPHYSSTGMVTINDYYKFDGEFRVPTKASPMDGGIVWIYLGDMLNRPVFFNNVARGSTSTRVWKEKHWQLITEALQEKEYDFILWHQGESDDIESISEEESYQNMKFVIQKSREIQPDIVWVMAVNSYLQNVSQSPIKNAQQRIINEGLAIEGPHTDVLRSNPENMEGPYNGLGWGAEFAGPGLERHAILWNEVVVNLIN